MPLKAAVIGYWRFESGDFLGDSGANGLTLTNGAGGAAASQVALPGSGNGSLYPTTVGGSPNGSAASFAGGQILKTADSPLLTTTTFTIEAFITVASIGATQAIAGQLADATGSNRAYLFAISGTGLLQLNYGATAVASALAVSLNTDYYVAVTVNMADLTTGGITFYTKNLSTGVESFQGLGHAGTTITNSTAGFSIGSTSTPSSPFNGLIDEVRLSNTKLNPGDLLIPLSVPEPASMAVLAIGAGLAAMRRRRVI